ncbi:MAG: hypothetical protein E7J02_12110 [Staphylococcus warneri]|nr:hypothetical protein [Staphylococcus warneri]MDU4503723.1 hypothetical protein [Staphylococcus warneri]
MAAKTVKTIEDVKNKIETNLDKIDIDKIDFGEVKMSNETKAFELTNEKELEELIENMNTFINKLKVKKEQSKTEKINNKLINELQNGGQNAELLAQIFNK